MSAFSDIPLEVVAHFVTPDLLDYTRWETLVNLTCVSKALYQVFSGVLKRDLTGIANILVGRHAQPSIYRCIYLTLSTNAKCEFVDYPGSHVNQGTWCVRGYMGKCPEEKLRKPTFSRPFTQHIRKHDGPHFFVEINSTRNLSGPIFTEIKIQDTISLEHFTTICSIEEWEKLQEQSNTRNRNIVICGIPESFQAEQVGFS